MYSGELQQQREQSNYYYLTYKHFYLGLSLGLLRILLSKMRKVSKQILMEKKRRIQKEKINKSPKKTQSKKDDSSKLLALQNIRLSKWMKMLEDYPEKVHKKLKSRARKGIPDSYRSNAWRILTCSKILQEENESLDFSRIIKMKGDK